MCSHYVFKVIKHRVQNYLLNLNSTLNQSTDRWSFNLPVLHMEISQVLLRYDWLGANEKEQVNASKAALWTFMYSKQYLKCFPNSKPGIQLAGETKEDNL